MLILLYLIRAETAVVTNFLNNFQQSTLWISNTTEMPIWEITLQETKTEVILKVYISQVQLNTIDIKIGQETVLIQGQWQADEGYFDSSRFQSLIPLPYCINPQTTQAEIEPGILIVRFQKSAKIKQSVVEIKPKMQNFFIASRSNKGSEYSATLQEFNKLIINYIYGLHLTSVGTNFFKVLADRVLTENSLIENSLADKSLRENSLVEIYYGDFKRSICEY
ncbi:MAG TPA: hypothetical protein DEG17_16855 [Cyanobacteria bacterium UBA11149]|nr:hypothetical protein [Cyanobacteria bacterium UBA11367]HBE58707.1 hypothetical protein [Cyanobacteria bacterium UBA11366]HBK66211.1 hypothetical protein [Cyanobacteria bacterium UBA11166]HBR74764.1 hypothetical protein [Cyanobacteria bacterium UBA11159]HBS72302.1 hypothetical protein [Cyanobacteria bacterium UBA11153]HBW90492.1 hypothetical protein [Cyanobacteria bacterium UBA11149]HCA93883.1 hypothetical protein [Cyanobacteria bacterium UBA9226]